MTEVSMNARLSQPGELYEVLHDSVDVLLESGRDSARSFSQSRAVGPMIRSIEAHLKTAEAKTIHTSVVG